MSGVFAVFWVIGIYVALPLVTVSGWASWFKSQNVFKTFSTLSLLAFTLATISELLAISSMVYAHAVGGFRYYDPSLLRIYRWGALLSFAGLVVAAVGLLRGSSLRWHAVFCAVGTLIFWLSAAMTE
jgi:hypothetical protein